LRRLVFDPFDGLFRSKMAQRRAVVVQTSNLTLSDAYRKFVISFRHASFLDHTLDRRGSCRSLRRYRISSAPPILTIATTCSLFVKPTNGFAVMSPLAVGTTPALRLAAVPTATMTSASGRRSAKALSGRSRHDAYRHEFGSLRDAEADPMILALPEDLRDLALHLVAAHHGYARPVITAVDPDNAPSASAAFAQAAALRFARLQARWGPWGLAWWEALLRAADWAASRQLNERAEGL
jgi:hypothetical protein